MLPKVNPAEVGINLGNECIMNAERDTASGTNSMSTRFRRRVGRAPMAFLAGAAGFTAW